MSGSNHQLYSTCLLKPIHIHVANLIQGFVAGQGKRGIELEARLGNYNKPTTFQAGVPKSTFYKIFELFYKTPSTLWTRKSDKWETTLDSFWEHDVRGTASQTQTFVYLQKLPIINMDFQFDKDPTQVVRFSMKEERKLEPLQAQNLAHVQTEPPKLCRYKRRFSFVYNEMFSYDFTISCQGPTKEAAAKSAVTYELEIELIPCRRLMDRIVTESIYDVAGTFLEKVMDILELDRSQKIPQVTMLHKENFS